MKKRFIFQEIKLFSIKHKNYCFLGKPFRVFHHCFFECFHFFEFWSLQMFSGVSIVHYIFSLHCFFTVAVTTRAAGLRECFLLLGVFYLTLLSCFYQGLPAVGSSALKVAVVPAKAKNTGQADRFIWITHCSAIIW